MKTFKYFNDIPKDFTGSCTVLDYKMSIAYFVNGKLHNEDDSAIIYDDGLKAWYYQGKFHGWSKRFTVESWEEKVGHIKYLEREEELKIFK